MLKKAKVFLGVVLILGSKYVCAKGETVNKNIFTEYLSLEGQSYMALSKEFGKILNNNDEKTGCIGKQFDTFGEGWIMYFYYGLREKGILEAPILTYYHAAEDEIQGSLDKLIQIYGAYDSFCTDEGGEETYYWKNVEHGQYDMKYIIDRSANDQVNIVFCNILDGDFLQKDERIKRYNEKKKDAMKNGTAGAVEITVKGETFGVFSLDENMDVVIGDTNICRIEDGSCRMIEAKCPNHICIDTGRITKSGETIVCLPNEVVIQCVLQKAGDENDVDIITW
ncbi:MAG: NusG domain II-containing protein [Lachnospiraceae bacterium]|nr:NusG domain II-containing protein [Lachnospiraceae bacterium]